MNEFLQEFVSSGGVAMRVDRAGGVIRGVKLLGLQSRNQRSYLASALSEAAALYEGAKVNVNHPKGHPLAARDYQDRLGSIRNVTVRQDGLFADLHFNPKHALAEQLAWDAAHAPENVGLSHNVEARTSRRAGQTVVEAILKVQSVDLVADPATTRSLYEDQQAQEPSDQVLLADCTLDQLRNLRPDLVTAIADEATAELRSQVERLQAREAVRQKRDLADRLIREFRLDVTDADQPGSGALVSQAFLEALAGAADEAAMRALVRERADLVAAARRLGSPFSERGRPRSREQRQYLEQELQPCLNAREFARAVS